MKNLCVSIVVLCSVLITRGNIASVVETGLAGDAAAVIANAAFAEDALTFSDRTHQHNGAAFSSATGLLSTSGDMIVPLPAYLVGGDYVLFANNARDNAGYSAIVTADGPYDWYLLIDNRGNGPVGDTSSPNTDDPVLGGTFQWVLDGGWTRVNTGISPNGQADYTGIDESGDGAGAGVGLNQFYAVYTKANQTSVEVRNNGFGGNMIALVGKPAQIVGPPKPKILLVSDNAYSGTGNVRTGDPEVGMQSFLEGLGYQVIRATGSGSTAQFRETQQGAAGARAIIEAEGVRLVIVSRVTDSGNYDANTAEWNALEVPMLMLAPHVARNNRWMWLPSDVIDQGAITDLVFVDPSHPFVVGLGTDIFDTSTSMDRVGITDPGNGTLIATTPDGDVALLEWEPGEEFYAGSGQIAGGRRVLMGGFRYHETAAPREFVFEDYSDNGLAILARIINNLAPISDLMYGEPEGGWAYRFDGDAAAPGVGTGFDALDGTWSQDNGSDSWDGSDIGSGAPGGVSALLDGTTSFLRIQDTGDPRDHGTADPSNRKIYLGHSITADGFGGNILDDGFTLSFRAKIATGAPLDSLYPDSDGTGELRWTTGGTAWPAAGNGYLGHDGGKGNISIRQSSFGVISCSLALASEPRSDQSPHGTTGLVLNGRSGSAASASVDPWQNEGTPNILPMDDLTAQFHEFWMTIQADTTGGGTHRVDLYADGSLSPTTFHVTAGDGNDFSGVNYLAIGAGGTPQLGAWDLDFIAYKPGIHEPVSSGGGSKPGFELQPVSLTLDQGDPATFSVIVTGTPPRTIQWRRDGVDIPGANNPTYSIAQTTLGDSGAVFTVVASNRLGTATSDPALLTVVEDTTPPTFLGAASANGMQIGVKFDDEMDLNQAVDPFLWEINGVIGTVALVTPRPDERSFTLTLNTPVTGQFTITAIEQKDRNGNALPEAAATVTGVRWLEDVVDIGSPLPAGQHFTAAEGEIEMEAGGGDIWDTVEQGTFAYKRVSGNFDVQVRVDRLDFVGNSWSKAGLNIRSSANQFAQTLAWIYPTPLAGANQVEFGRRRLDGSGGWIDVNATRPNVNQFPFWVRVRRVGTEVTGFWSRDGVTWNLHGTENQAEPSFPDEMLVSVALTSHIDGTPTHAEFSEFRDVNLYPNAVITVTGPADVTVDEYNPARFEVGATVVGAPQEALWYEWQQETSPDVFETIPAATGPTLDIPRPTMADQGKRFRVIVSASGSNPVTSRTAVLTVTEDLNPPTVVSAKGNATFDQIRVVFSEPVSGLDPFSYELATGGGPSVSGAVGLVLPGADESEVVLVMAAGYALTPDTDYTLSVVGGVFDLANNEIAPDSSADFHSFVLSTGFAQREFYFNIGSGVLVSDLTGAPTYPGAPDLADYNTLLEGVVNVYDNYGIRISGFLKPKTTGVYDFYISADDGAEFWLSSDADPVNKALVCREPQWNNSRQWLVADRRDAVNPENRSLTLFPDGIALEAGRLYYYEALMKEGGGGDNVGVAVGLHGEAPPLNGSSPIAGAFNLVVGADPSGANIDILQQPQDVAVTQGCGSGDEGPQTAFLEPDGGWAYRYDGSAINGLGSCKPSQVLDMTWSANNGSSEFDGSLRGPGVGAKGGISSDGDILTIEDVNQGSGSCNNRKIYFTHDLTQELDAATAGTILDQGVTISFRARLTQPDIDPAAEFALPDGWGIFSAGKGHFGVRQSNPSSIVSFSLVRQAEPDNSFNFGSAGLTMNRLNGDAVMGNEVNSTGNVADNPILPLDPNAFHEFWITLQANDGTAGNGTHTVNVYMDGIEIPSTFNVTAGNGNEGASLNMIAMGLNNSGGQSAVDVDFFAYKPGVYAPKTSTPKVAYKEPAGGWNYLYDGSAIDGLGSCKPSQVLDLTWSANNGSSEFDGSLRGAGNGAQGGISSDGDILTIEDVNQGSGSCNNRKIYFTHDLAQELDSATAGKILDNGVTLTFRARLTQPDIVPGAEITLPDGWGIFSEGKGHFGVRQSNPSSIVSFSLVRESEPDNTFNFGSAGLTMNRLNGDSPAGSGAVNSSGTAANNPILPLDPNEFHEFWVTIQANDGTAGNGTHTVRVYMDGETTPATYNVTAGTGNEGSSLNMIAMGLNNSGGQSAVDVDFFGYKAGVHAPEPSVPPVGTPVEFNVDAVAQISGNNNAPIFVQWQKDGVDIPGANTLTLATRVTKDDQGAQFRALIHTPGAQAISDPATVLLNEAPEVAIVSPADGASISVCAPVVAAATATDSDGAVVRVEFFVEGVGSIGADTDGSDGWGVTVPNPSAGVYLLTAVATDNLGASCVSSQVMVTLTDQTPVCTAATAATPEDTAVNVVLTATDDDAVLTYSVADPPAHGTVSVAGNVATYMPNLNYCGPDSFTFKAVDPCGSESVPCTVTIDITGLPDAPVCADASATGCEDQPIALTLSAADPDVGSCMPEALTFAVMTPPANGTVSIAGNVATYQGSPDYSGSDSFTYQVTDMYGLVSGVCTVSVTVTAGNDSPVGVIAVMPTVDLGPSVPGINVMSPNNIGACVTLDATQSSDVDNDFTGLSFTWMVNGMVVGTGPVLSDVCLLVGENEVKLVVNDNSGASGACDEPAESEAVQVVTVLTGMEASEELINQIYESVIERKNKQQFIATCKTAAAAFERGSFGAGLNMLEALINKFEAQLDDNPDIQTEWILRVQGIVDGITQPVTCDGCAE